MDLKVLGLLAVQESGTPIVPTAAPTRQLLALLAAHADHIVPTAVLTQELWPEGAPRHAQEMVETYVRQLRELIDDALDVRREETTAAAAGPRTAREVLVSLSGGYRLGTGGGTSDVRMFQRAVGAGYRAMELEDYRTAAERLGQALELWTADAYTGVLAGPHLRAHGARLEQSRLRALDLWVEAQRRLGRRHELYAGLSVFLSRFRSSPPEYEALVAELERGPEREPVGRPYETVGRSYEPVPAVRVGSLLHSLRHSLPTRHRAPVAG
ncbi:BTAD domain-containing putative transcriptional regulator [Streptomyces sp. P9(2023)]|uniref:AfsR/SARP family transcriptional regulator n=1 Tax=Streptomyces sp. P9(2023) TaxID=3064394 RepID=UPI0028F4468E|nr:BTAD domain-containing putative transcriptional regulator [Streptomyces sp. P9(2023)]MDT9690244.1 BTAD domain-containing putative transcriptional regulator [Streptomyces sp. P9(2023)]